MRDRDLEHVQFRRVPPLPLLALLYGPAARCKPKMMIWRRLVLRFCIRPMMEPWSSWPSWISARVRSHSQLGHEGQKGHLITNALARPFSPSPLFNSQTSAGNPLLLLGLA